MLQSFDIGLLADVRSYPRSKRWPQFNQHALTAALTAAGIQYHHFPALGGKGLPAQQEEQATLLRGYLGYMQTETFKAAIRQLETAAMQHRTAYMCAEADWQHCHRSYISDYLAKQAWEVIHITGRGTAAEHGAPRNIQGRLFG